MAVVPLQLTGYPGVPLTADCSSCFALCCSALGFERSSDFAHDKPIGQACHNLADDFSCTIHGTLRGAGYRGCTVFDCFGAGQQVAQSTFGGRSWTEHPEVRGPMFAVFPVVRQLHEVLWYLDEALALLPAPAGQGPDRGAPGEASRADGGRPGSSPGVPAVLASLIEETVALTRRDPAGLAGIDLDDLRRRVGGTLMTVSRAARRGGGGARPHRRFAPGADLLGAQLSGVELRGADLRGACLIAADLTGADLRLADLLGADLRDARLQGADLSTALFLTPMQVSAAQGDRRTALPGRLPTPPHWLG